MSKLQLVLLVFIFLIFPANSALAKRSFKAFFKTDLSTYKAVQKEVDYNMVKSLSLCRGHFVTKRLSKWKCGKKGSRASCLAKFKCALVTKKFNRPLEMSRLKKSLKTHGKKLSYQLYVTKKPLVMGGQSKKSKSTNDVKKPLYSEKAFMGEPLKFTEDGSEIVLFNDDIEEVASNGINEKDVEHVDFENTKEVKKEASKEAKQETKAKIKKEKVDDDPFADPMDADEDDDDEDEEVEDDTVEESSVGKDEEDDGGKRKPFELLRFGTQYVTVNTTTNGGSDESYSGFSFSYRPKWQINQKWSVVPIFAIHSLSLPESTGLSGQSYSVTTIAVTGQYHFSNGFYLTGGYGTQSWSVDVSDDISFTRLSYGVGYQLSKRSYYIDDLHLIGSSLSEGTINGAEIILGLTFSFY